MMQKLSEELFFDEKLHQYTNKEGELYIGSTTFIGKFHKKFEDVADFWLYYKSVQYLSAIDKPREIKKYNEELDNAINRILFTATDYKRIQRYALSTAKEDFNKFRSYFSAEEVLALDRASALIADSWNQGNQASKIKGTTFHNWKEDAQISSNVFEWKGERFKVNADAESLHSLAEGVYPELRLYNHEYKIAGTTDQAIIGADKSVIIRDWKGLALDTLIPTPRGFKKMDAVEVGDVIYDGLGVPTRVSHVSEIHYNPCYKMIFSDGSEVVADHEHKWEFHTPYSNIPEVNNTEYLFHKLRTYKGADNKVEITSPVFIAGINTGRFRSVYVDRIEEIPIVATKCLGVESYVHTYLFGENYIKTHNTNIEIKTSNKYARMLPPIEHLPDANYYHYSLQLSLYAWMLEAFGYTVKHIEFEHFDLASTPEGYRIERNTVYEVDYMKKEIEDMLNYYKEGRI